MAGSPLPLVPAQRSTRSVVCRDAKTSTVSAQAPAKEEDPVYELTLSKPIGIKFARGR